MGQVLVTNSQAKQTHFQQTQMDIGPGKEGCEGDGGAGLGWGMAGGSLEQWIV